jgi:GTPase SAR1 family protein
LPTKERKNTCYKNKAYFIKQSLIHHNLRQKYIIGFVYTLHFDFSKFFFGTMASSTLSAQLPTQTSSVSKSQPINETITDLNILLLGETGVGKTTFINAFVNHLTYNTLDEAIKGNMIVVIPASFSITDPNTYDSKVIQIGTPDKNENNSEDGHSKTQGCKSYVFPVGNRNLRLIDAPGIGDTRGVDQDAKNFEHILAYISQYKHLDGICILLSPNIQRMNVLFRFCLKELLTHLHVSAKNNIMFVFTFARTNFYTPGHTAPILKSLLRELSDKNGIDVPFTSDNTFCFDNESFRFLAVQEKGVEYLSEQVQEFSKSWNVSVKEYGNLVDRIVNCTPHMIRDTLSLNEAQQLIRKLHRPIAEIMRFIEENIQLAEKYKAERSNDATTTINSSSSDHISVPQYSAEVVVLPYPRTVCTSESCIRIIVVESVQKIDYSTHCHEHCYLTGVEQEVINNPALKACTAMNQTLGMCKQYDKVNNRCFIYEEISRRIEVVSFKYHNIYNS